jgi:hypothetical protein
MLQQIDVEYEASEGEVFSPRTSHDLMFNFSLNCLSLLQHQAPVVLFYKNALPILKIILDH